MPDSADTRILSPAKLTAEAVKRVRWAVSKDTSRLAITKSRVGLVGMGLNAVLRRPAEFPTIQYARFRREILAQARAGEFTDADIAVIKLRADLLGSPIDSRYSAPVDGADVDRYAIAAISEVEDEHGVTFDNRMRESVFDTAWSQFGEFFGTRAMPRASHIAQAADFVPATGDGLARALREAEARHVEQVRTHPRLR